MRIKLLLFASLTACGAAGGMHQATLVGHCAADDAACSHRHALAPLAIGAHFRPELATAIDGTTTPNLRLESAEPDVLAVDATGLVARHEGTSAVLISTDDGAVVDFVHIWVAPVTSITLARRDGDPVAGALGLAVGDDVTLVPALWHGAQQLAGAADAQWSIDADAPITVLHDGSSDRRRLRARAPGKATVTVAFGDTKTSIDVEVVP